MVESLTLNSVENLLHFEIRAEIAIVTTELYLALSLVGGVL